MCIEQRCVCDYSLHIPVLYKRRSNRSMEQESGRMREILFKAKRKDNADLLEVE